VDNPQNAPRHTVSSDPLIPGEIAERLEAANVQRASLPTSNLVLLGLLGGVYIGFGGALATLVATDATLGYGLGRLASGLAFSLGLIMLVLAGGELFTGNNLMVLAFAGRKVSSRALLRNWGIAYLANAAGAILLAVAIHLSGVADNAALKATAIRIAEAKVQLGVAPAFLRGVLCNMLVCLGDLAECRCAQRRRQSYCHCPTHKRLCGPWLRALHRKLLSSAGRQAERCSYEPV